MWLVSTEQAGLGPSKARVQGSVQGPKPAPSRVWPPLPPLLQIDARLPPGAPPPPVTTGFPAAFVLAPVPGTALGTAGLAVPQPDQ